MKRHCLNKRIAALLLAFALSCIFNLACAEEWTCPACGNAARGNYCGNCGRKRSDANFDMLYESALDAAKNMTAFCAADGIASLYSTDPEVTGIIAHLANFNYIVSTPSRALVMYAKWDDLKALIPVINEMADIEINALLEYRRGSILNLLTTSLNSAIGLTWMAATSICSTSGVTLLENIDEGFAYVLLDYSAEVPEKILVSFYISPTGATAVNASFIKDIGFVDLLFGFENGTVDLQTLSGMTDMEDELSLIAQLIDLIQLQAY